MTDHPHGSVWCPDELPSIPMDYNSLEARILALWFGQESNALTSDCLYNDGLRRLGEAEC